MTSRCRAAVIALAAVLALVSGCGDRKKEAAAPPYPFGANFVVNPSFEEWDGSQPVGWKLEHFEGEGKKENICGRSTQEQKSGKFSYSMRGVFDVERWMILVQRHPVTPGYRLWFSAEMRSKKLHKNKGQEGRANVFVRFYDEKGKRVNESRYADAQTPSMGGTNSWRRIGKRVEIPKEARTVEIGLICQATGWMYFDDVEMFIETPVPWKEIETKYVNFYYLEERPFPPGAIDKQTEFVESVVKKLDIEVDNKIGFYLYPSEEKFRELVGVKRGHERALWARQEFHTTSTYEDHELIHMLLVPYGYPPFGIGEGIVFYILGSWEGRDLHLMAKQALTSMTLPALYRLMTREAMDEAGMSSTVPGWSSFSIWLIERHGLDKFMELYKATDEVKLAADFAPIFKRIYGQEFDVMDREWRLWVLRYQMRS